MPLYVCLADGSVFPYSRFDHLPPQSVLVNSMNETTARIDGLIRLKRTPATFAVDRAKAEVNATAKVETLQSKPSQLVTRAEPITIQKASRQVLSFLETALDSSRGSGKFVKVNREQLADAFALCDFVTSRLEEDE